MKFSTDIKIKENYFLSQPHQPFFALGIVNALIMMFFFALSYRDVFSVQTDMKIFHVYSLIFLVFTNFFIGFLFTTFPRFCQGKNINKIFYLRIFYANILSAILFLSGSLFVSDESIAGMLISFISQGFVAFKLYDIYKNGNSVNKKDPFWILIAFCFGLAGNVFFIISNFISFGNIVDIAVNLSFYMYLIFLTFSVAQRMIPFFSHSMEPKSEKFINIVFLFFIIKTVVSIYDYNIYFKIIELILDLVFGVYLLKEFIRWKLPVLTSPAILWVLHLGLFWFPVGLLIQAVCLSLDIVFDLNFYFLGIHLIAIGFLLTIFIGFGTRVTLGHSGGVPHAGTFEKIIFVLIQFILLFRVLFSLNITFGMNLNFLFDISFLLWMILFAVWGWVYGKILVFG